MLDGVMANNAIGMAFGGGLQDMKHAAQGRTYYMSCSSREEAEEWKNAITNNVRALPAPQSKRSVFILISLHVFDVARIDTVSCRCLADSQAGFAILCAVSDIL